MPLYLGPLAAFGHLFLKIKSMALQPTPVLSMFVYVPQSDNGGEVSCLASFVT